MVTFILSEVYITKLGKTQLRFFFVQDLTFASKLKIKKVELTEFVSFKSCVHASIYNPNVESNSALKMAALIVKIGLLKKASNEV